MFDLDSIVRQVNRNCRISDSSHAGSYSICDLAMRLRDLYKWEKDLDPWVEDESSKVLAWIGEQEEVWDNLAEEDFRSISISGREYDPLDEQQINRILAPHGFYYGAGYVHRLKPSFFLAVLEEKKWIENQPVFILGHELARDLVTIPALSRDGSVIIRKASAKVFFWDQIFYVKKSGRQALRFALGKYGVGEDLHALRPHLNRILEGELNRYIYHELGEIRDHEFDRDIWREIIAGFPYTPIELVARCIRTSLQIRANTGPSRTFSRIEKKGCWAFMLLFSAASREKFFLRSWMPLMSSRRGGTGRLLRGPYPKGTVPQGGWPGKSVLFLKKEKSKMT